MDPLFCFIRSYLLYMLANAAVVLKSGPSDVHPMVSRYSDYAATVHVLWYTQGNTCWRWPGFSGKFVR
jgi:hypothetical protein